MTHEGLPTKLSLELGYRMGRGSAPQANPTIASPHISLLDNGRMRST